MNDKLLSMLGLARRAGRLSCGFDASVDSMKIGKSALLLLANDLSERTERAVKAKAEQYSVGYIMCGRDMSSIGNAIGKKMTGIISVNDSGFAEKLKALCAENRQEECIDDKI